MDLESSEKKHAINSTSAGLKKGDDNKTKLASGKADMSLSSYSLTIQTVLSSLSFRLIHTSSGRLLDVDMATRHLTPTPLKARTSSEELAAVSEMEVLFKLMPKTRRQLRAMPCNVRHKNANKSASPLV